MGFAGNQALYAVSNALGARTVGVSTSFASARGGVPGGTSWQPEPQQFRRDVAFAIAQRPAVMVVGYVPKPSFVDIIATQLADYKGVILLDPVIGSYQKGLFVSEETARAIAEQLVPRAQIVTPNRFEAELLLGKAGGRHATEHAFLNGIFDLGPQGVAVTSFERDAEKHELTLLFTNGYTYQRITAPFYPTFPAHGAGDVFAAATALCTRAVVNTTAYGGATVDPVAALSGWGPLAHHLDDDAAMRFCERANVKAETIQRSTEDGPRLKFAPCSSR
jgi:pyridoxal/pyridoxine/pyridoxamine kinase